MARTPKLYNNQQASKFATEESLLSKKYVVGKAGLKEMEDDKTGELQPAINYGENKPQRKNVIESKNTMLKILLAEDHNIVRSGIRSLLEDDECIAIVAEAVNGSQALDYIKNNEPIDIVLTDIDMPVMDGISLIREVKKLNPHIKIVILSMHDNEKYVAQAFEAGASGYLLKNVAADELIFALKYINRGGKYVCAELSMSMLAGVLKKVTGSISTAKSAVEFSSREIQVLELIAEGLTNQEMSDRLFISKRTVEGHRQSLTDKTGCRNTAALIRYAMMNDIVQ